MSKCSFCDSISSNENNVVVNEGNTGKQGASICKYCIKLSIIRLEENSESENKIIDLFNDEPLPRLS